MLSYITLYFIIGLISTEFLVYTSPVLKIPFTKGMYIISIFCCPTLIIWYVLRKYFY